MCSWTNGNGVSYPVILFIGDSKCKKHFSYKYALNSAPIPHVDGASCVIIHLI